MSKKPQSTKSANKIKKQEAVLKIEELPQYSHALSDADNVNTLTTSELSITPDFLEEPAIELEQPQKQMSADTLPEKIRMLKDFRIDMPLAGRRDVSMTMLLKKDRIIDDKRIIKHVVNSYAEFSEV